MEESQRRAAYRSAYTQIEALTAGGRDPIAAMASTASVLHNALPRASWTGFYRVVEPNLLRVGPYQGPVGCLEIRFGHGVCGVAAESGQTQIVPDVHAFPGHIACDSASRSEIVVPILNSSMQLVAVLDIDSHSPSAFDEVDGEELGRIVKLLAPTFD